jgi:putative sigma-54 modulation protein
MQVNVHSIQFKADGKLVAFIESKLDKLEQYNDRIIGAEVFLKLDNNNGDDNKISEIKLIVPGKDLFAKRQSTSFEESTDQVAEALRRQLRKQKGKQAMMN